MIIQTIKDLEARIQEIINSEGFNKKSFTLEFEVCSSDRPHGIKDVTIVRARCPSYVGGFLVNHMGLDTIIHHFNKATYDGGKYL